LSCLEPQFKAAGIVSPTPTRRSLLAAQWSLPEYSSLDQVDLSQIDVIAISIPPSQNAKVLRQLKQLQPAGARAKLVIDTPIAAGPTELADISPALEGFGYVAVAEDYMNFPPHVLMRQAVEAGVIGTPKSIVLNNTGYLYHGLALIRCFTGFKPVSRSHRQVMSRSAIAVHYRVAGLQATVIGPYRRHTAGGNVIDGTMGTITEFMQDISPGDKNIYYLRTLREAGEIIGYEIDGTGMSLALPELTAMRALDFPDKSDLNLLRGWGLMQVFKSVCDPGNFNRKYSIKEAFYDSIVSRLATRGLFPFDPFVAIGWNGLGALRIAGLLRSKLK